MCINVYNTCLHPYEVSGCSCNVPCQSSIIISYSQVQNQHAAWSLINNQDESCISSLYCIDLKEVSMCGKDLWSRKGCVFSTRFFCVISLPGTGAAVGACLRSTDRAPWCGQDWKVKRLVEKSIEIVKSRDWSNAQNAIISSIQQLNHDLTMVQPPG